VKYNCNYGTRNSRISKPIIQYDKNNNFIKRWKSQKEAEDALHIIHINCCCKGRAKTAGGYIWRYEKESEK